MHVFLYEWITGGGLVEEPGSLPPSLLAEGAAMLTALADDLAAIDGARVSVLRDIRLDELVLDRCEVTEVHSNEHRRDEFMQLTAAADHTLIIAPEFDELLLQTIGLAREAGGRPVAGSDEFVRIAADKQRTAQRLAQACVPVPPAVILAADEERLPGDFSYPAVLKPVCGAGSQHTLLVADSRDEPPAYPWRRRLERYCPGIAASVAFLCNATRRIPLPPCRQHLSTDGRFSYLGGALILDLALARRATTLADAALAALPPSLGYVGVDLVLGNAADGAEDYVIEVNPRITTSYVGLRAATSGNLAAALLDTAAGNVSTPEFTNEPLEFSSYGSLRQPIN